MKCFAWLVGRGRRFDTGAPEPETSLAQGPRDLGLSLRARTPDSFSYQVPPRRVVVGPTEGGAVEQVHDRVAGLDVHRDVVAACVRVAGPRGGVATEKERFQTTTVALERLGGWWPTVRFRWSRWRRRACIGSRSTTRWSRASRCGCATPITSRTCLAARPTCPTRS